MDEPIQGITQVDSLYEALGLQAAGRLMELFGRVQLPLVVILATTAWLFYEGAERGTYRRAAVYFFCAAFLWFLLSPVSVLLPAKDQPLTFTTPRLLFHLNGACDALSAAATNGHSKLREEMADDRLGFVLREIRIADPRLAREAGEFLRDCAGPEIAAREAAGQATEEYLLLPMMVSRFERLGPTVDAKCRARRDLLHEQVRRHLASREEIRAALTNQRWRPLLERVLGVRFDFKTPVSDYLVNVAVARAWTEAGSDLARAERATGGSGLELVASERHNSLPVPRFDALGTAAVHLYSRGSMEVEARAKRYELMMHAPKFYGLSLMLAMAAFPLAALFALLPSGWAVLANFAKIFVSVKLWPVFWNLLSVFNDVTGEPDARLVLPAIYGIIPVVSFVLVNLASGASGDAFRKVVDPGPSPMPVVNAAAMKMVP